MISEDPRPPRLEQLRLVPLGEVAKIGKLPGIDLPGDVADPLLERFERAGIVGDEGVAGLLRADLRSFAALDQLSGDLHAEADREKAMMVEDEVGHLLSHRLCELCRLDATAWYSNLSAHFLGWSDLNRRRIFVVAAAFEETFQMRS